MGTTKLNQKGKNEQIIIHPSLTPKLYNKELGKEHLKVICPAISISCDESPLSSSAYSGRW